MAELVPGLTLVVVVTAAAYGLRQIPGFAGVSPMFSAILIGMMVANLSSVPREARPGLAIAGKNLLRFAVALLGLQLTLSQVSEIGAAGMIMLALVVACTYAFTLGVGSLLGVNGQLTRLLAAGTSICGASAIAAANSVEKGRDEDVAYAIACVTLFGTLAIVIYPLVASILGLAPQAFGFWAGASIHEVAQVVATGFQQGSESGELAVVVKLSRVLLLAPLLIVVALLAARRRAADGLPIGAGQIIPSFVAAFIALMLANTFGLVPEEVRSVIIPLTPILLTAALGAIGLGTRLDTLRAQGIRPLLLGALASLFISTAGLAVVGLLP